MEDRIQQLIFRAIDQEISDSEFDALQDALETDSAARAAYLQAVGLVETLGDLASESSSLNFLTPRLESASLAQKPSAVVQNRSTRWGRVTLASLAVAMVAGAAFWLGRMNAPEESHLAVPIKSVASTQRLPETQIAGHATLRRAVDLVWSPGAVHRREGDVLPDGVFSILEGVVEIDFFCGAMLIVEGPAELDIESDWSVKVVKGRLRANVPPAARGFVVKAAGSEIIDLGTEFAMDVGQDNAMVEVIDGEVELRGGQYDGQHLYSGGMRSLTGQNKPASIQNLSTIADVRLRQEAVSQRRYADWAEYRQTLFDDDRVIAYFPMSESKRGRFIKNTSNLSREANGLLVGPVERTMGRFGNKSSALKFDRPGARVRTRIDGEFDALTLMCWVRIDSLANRYNSLFMSDGYENGEIHWQIGDNGKLLFSVMVDDQQDVQYFEKRDQKMVHDAGLHKVYFTESFWEPSNRGQWFHLAAVYDPANRCVQQFVNGELLSQHEISEKYLVRKLRIGAAEIGNWGQPFRKTPWFAVRNLSGAIDEMMVFGSAIDSAEILSLYQHGAPAGY